MESEKTNQFLTFNSLIFPKFFHFFFLQAQYFYIFWENLTTIRGIFMAITKVWLDESSDECVSCGACEATCDAVFSVPEKMVVKEGVDFSAYENEIKDAAESCPAGVIKFS